MKKLGVLLVDDEIMIREGFKRLFDWEAHNCEVVGEAADGMQALAQIDNLRPDIVIMDIIMPGLDGLETAQILMKKHPDVKIMMLSSLCDASTLEEVRGIGLKYLIPKPWEDDVLLATLEMLSR